MYGSRGGHTHWALGYVSLDVASNGWWEWDIVPASDVFYWERYYQLHPDRRGIATVGNDLSLPAPT